jgi:hypothetical protein
VSTILALQGARSFAWLLSTWQIYTNLASRECRDFIETKPEESHEKTSKLCLALSHTNLFTTFLVSARIDFDQTTSKHLIQLWRPILHLRAWSLRELPVINLNHADMIIHIMIARIAWKLEAWIRIYHDVRRANGLGPSSCATISSILSKVRSLEHLDLS